MKQDILADITKGSVSLEEAESIYDHIMDSPEAFQAAELLGLTRVEWTAFCQGIGFDVLARWRYQGWPDICPQCNRKVELEKIGWLIKQKGNEYVIIHVKWLD